MKKAGAAVLVIAVIGLLVVLLQNYKKSQTMPTTPKQESAASPPAAPQTYPSVAPSSPITPHDRQLVGELNQILTSKNDNDPRLDTDFKNLTYGTKLLLVQKYNQLPMESRNERGTIVFLIGREINQPEDCRFLAQVTLETPCLNLADCKKPPSHTDEDVHEEPAISVTLAYPQHVAVKSMENFLGKKTPDPSLMDSCLSSLDQMTESPIPVISRKAADLRSRYRNGN